MSYDQIAQHKITLRTILQHIIPSYWWNLDNDCTLHHNILDFSVDQSRESQNHEKAHAYSKHQAGVNISILIHENIIYVKYSTSDSYTSVLYITRPTTQLNFYGHRGLAAWPDCWLTISLPKLFLSCSRLISPATHTMAHTVAIACANDHAALKVSAESSRLNQYSATSLVMWSTIWFRKEPRMC